MSDVDYIHVMKLAYNVARKSPDPSTQNGAVVISGSDYAEGKNYIPKGFEPNYEDREHKYGRVVHAEEDAILSAGKHFPTLNATLVCPWAPCIRCAISIIRAGIKTVVVHKQRMEHAHGGHSSIKDWGADIQEAVKALKENRIAYLLLDYRFDDSQTILVGGKDWQP